MNHSHGDNPSRHQLPGLHRPLSPSPDTDSDCARNYEPEQAESIPDSDSSRSIPERPLRTNCHLMGPTCFCECKSDHSFVIQSPKTGIFRQKKRLLILDIDETILNSRVPLLGHDIFVRNRSASKLPSLDPDIDGVWQYGFEMFFLHGLDVAAVLRLDYFKTLEFMLEHDFNVILYTRYYLDCFVF